MELSYSGIILYVHMSGKQMYLHILHFSISGVFGEAPDLCRDRHLPCQLEAYRVGSHSSGIQGLGRPGGVECRLLPNSQGYHCGGHVSCGGNAPKALRFIDMMVVKTTLHA